jgi:hypothetical protein
MSLKLNGWQRLWVVASVIAIIPFSYFVFLNFRTVEDITHDNSYYSRMSDEDRQKLIIKSSKNNDVHNENIAASVSLPNGYVLLFNKDYDAATIEQVSKSYYEILKEESAKQNKTLIINNILAWLSISIMVYVLGFGIAWIIKGFKK